MTDRQLQPPEALRADAQLPDPDELHVLEAELLRPEDHDPDW